MTLSEHPGFFPEAIKDSVTRQLLASIWCTGTLEAEAWARGFQGAQDAVEAVKLFVLGFLRDRVQEDGR